MIENEVVQKIIKPSYDECRNELYKLYGYDYTYLRHFEIKKTGLAGLFSKPQICMMYKVKPRSNPEMVSSYTESSSGTDFLARMAEAQAVNDEEERLAQNREKILAQQTSTIMNAQFSQMADIQSALEHMQETLNKKLSASGSANKHPNVARIEELLSDNEFSYTYINMITDKILSTFSQKQLDDFDLVEKCVVDWIGETIQVAPSHHVRPPRIVILVGPTGVGKTTTLVKLVAKSLLSAKNAGAAYEARLITTDYSRVGAMEQLKHFGEILGRDVDKAENVDDLKKLIEKYRRHCDGIFIDTGGYSPNDSVHIGKLKDVVSVPGITPDVFLAFDAKTKSSDIKNIMNNYEPFDYGSVIVTKCDESGLYGNIISSLYEKHKKIAFITDGQNAARNLERATPVYFLERLKGFNLDMERINKKFTNSEEN